MGSIWGRLSDLFRVCFGSQLIDQSVIQSGRFFGWSVSWSVGWFVIYSGWVVGSLFQLVGSLVRSVISLVTQSVSQLVVWLGCWLVGQFVSQVGLLGRSIIQSVTIIKTFKNCAYVLRNIMGGGLKQIELVCRLMGRFARYSLLIGWLFCQLIN